MRKLSYDLPVERWILFETHGAFFDDDRMFMIEFTLSFASPDGLLS